MELALAIFNIGAGIGIAASGAALLFLAWQARPLIRETHALAADARRVTQLLDGELRPILASARELGGNVEVLSGDVAVKLDRLTDLRSTLQISLDTVRIAAVPRRPAYGSVESWDAAEDSARR